MLGNSAHMRLLDVSCAQSPCKKLPLSNFETVCRTDICFELLFQMTDSEYTPSVCSDEDTAVVADTGASEVLQEHLESMRELMHAMLEETEELEARLLTLQRPIEDLALEQLGDVPFLQASPFRHQTFLLKVDGIPGFTAGQRYPYHELVSVLRAHLIETGAMDAEGVATLAKPLQRLLGVEEERLSFLQILGHLRKILH